MYLTENLELIRDWFPQLKGLSLLSENDLYGQSRRDYSCFVVRIIEMVKGYAEEDYSLVRSCLPKVDCI